MTYRLWFRSVSLGFVSYRAFVLNQRIYQLDFGRHGKDRMTGDPLERLNTVVAWGLFRNPLAKALNCSDRLQGGRSPYDA